MRSWVQKDYALLQYDSITLTFSFLIDDGKGMEVPPPMLLRVEDPRGGDGEVGAS